MFISNLRSNRMSVVLLALCAGLATIGIVGCGKNEGAASSTSGQNVGVGAQGTGGQKSTLSDQNTGDGGQKESVKGAQTAGGG